MELLRASVIDLGSNTVKLVNYRISPDSNYKHYQDESVRTKLGEGLTQTGYLSDEAMSRAISALKRFREIIDLQSIQHVLPVATSAVREAGNNFSFLQTIFQETGFKFRILSEKEEALYSYFGAARSLKKPSMLFFDLGGGSLEIVHAENFKIKKIISLPLGALRLTQMYADKPDGSFSSKSMEKLKERVLSLIPSLDEFEISENTILVGVGGTLRNIVKFHQTIMNYPLTKVHNYSMSYSAINEISAKFQSMKPERIAKIESINSGRAETITAGSFVISLLMEKLQFNQVTISAQALREGTLDVSLEFFKDYSLGKEISEKQIEDSVKSVSDTEILPSYLDTLLHILIDDEKLDNSSTSILYNSIKHLSEISSFRNFENLLHIIMDDDSSLSHREQMISALTIIASRKKKKAEQIFKNYESVLKLDDKKVIKKLSALLLLDEIVEKTKANLSVKRILETIAFEVKVDGKFPSELFVDSIQKISDTFNVLVDFKVLDKKGNTKQENLQI